MKERYFCYWLKGVLSQINEGESISIETAKDIKRMLEEALYNPEYLTPYPAYMYPITEPFNPTC